MDDFDLRGLLKVMDDRVEESSGNLLYAYIGAEAAISLILTHEEIRDQSVFMAMFDQWMINVGIKREDND